MIHVGLAWEYQFAIMQESRDLPCPPKFVIATAKRFHERIGMFMELSMTISVDFINALCALAPFTIALVLALKA